MVTWLKRYGQGHKAEGTNLLPTIMSSRARTRGDHQSSTQLSTVWRPSNLTYDKVVRRVERWVESCDGVDIRQLLLRRVDAALIAVQKRLREHPETSDEQFVPAWVLLRQMLVCLRISTWAISALTQRTARRPRPPGRDSSSQCAPT